MKTFALLTCLLLGCGADSDDEPDPIECPAEAEVCGYRDGGWEASCADGVVQMASFNTTLYCAPEVSSEILCEVGSPEPFVVHACAAACGTADKKYLETIAEYNAFDTSTLCE